jgi:hypothetical protein
MGDALKPHMVIGIDLGMTCKWFREGDIASARR